jgi:hypothetical protein
MKNHQHAGGNHQPEAEVVHAGEGHVGRADLQGDHPVGEAHEGRHDGAEHHHHAVHGGQLVEQFRVDQLQAGLEQLGADQQGQHTAKHQHREGKQQVQRADVLVVGREHPAPPACGGPMVIMVVVVGVVVVV